MSLQLHCDLPKTTPRLGRPVTSRTSLLPSGTNQPGNHSQNAKCPVGKLNPVPYRFSFRSLSRLLSFSLLLYTMASPFLSSFRSYGHVGYEYRRGKAVRGGKIQYHSIMQSNPPSEGGSTAGPTDLEDEDDDNNNNGDDDDDDDDDDDNDGGGSSSGGSRGNKGNGGDSNGGGHKQQSTIS